MNEVSLLHDWAAHDRQQEPQVSVQSARGPGKDGKWKVYLSQLMWFGQELELDC